MSDLTITYNKKIYPSMTPEELLGYGIPQVEIDAAKTSVRAKLVSDECRRRIYLVAPAETQMNMAAASALISSKTSSTRTDDENSVLAGLGAAIGWVGAMRATVKTLTADPDKDFTAGEHWPDIPVAVAAVVEQF